DVGCARGDSEGVDLAPSGYTAPREHDHGILRETDLAALNQPCEVCQIVLAQIAHLIEAVVLRALDDSGCARDIRHRSIEAAILTREQRGGRGVYGEREG